jgi:hypothetical protein
VAQPVGRSLITLNSAPKNWHVSGQHFRDCYLLLDEQAHHIFAVRLAADISEARGVCDEHADPATAGRLEFEGYPPEVA